MVIAGIFVSIAKPKKTPENKTAKFSLLFLFSFVLSFIFIYVANNIEDKINGN